MQYGKQFQQLVAREEILVCPGVHDPLTARAADMVGFDALYMTGFGTSLAKTGLPDAGLVTMTEMVENGHNIQNTASVPVVCDADNGYGNATNVVRTVREYAHTGVGAIHIEDQTAPKRCGHASGREVISVEEATGKYRAAADERDRLDSDMQIIGRTDARGAHDGSLDDAIERANAYVDAGADIAFVEGPTDAEEVERVAEEVDAPLLYNCVGISPRLEPTELEELGYDIVIYPTAAPMAAIHSSLTHLKALDEAGRDGISEAQRAFEDETFADLPIESDLEETAMGRFFEFAGFPEIYRQEDRYLPEEEADKYENSEGVDITE
ncbi:isocitrate lyase/PEP mutase family protein [Halorarius halobius]|uniref:isocitrate lyase/PEP mutase family protein n=1 Tax=Halorarius halobius TaxID=2962671 RepID=UPI0020CF9172|nr:isocitrate lyase/PEP mutase family protein [Halorarius halobius]